MFKQLKCGWNSNVLRLPMGVDVEKGYLSDPEGQLKLVIPTTIYRSHDQ